MLSVLYGYLRSLLVCLIPNTKYNTCFQDKADEVIGKVKVQVDEIKSKVMSMIPVKSASAADDKKSE
mgnify:CR=1 FL=1